MTLDNHDRKMSREHARSRAEEVYRGNYSYKKPVAWNTSVLLTAGDMISYTPYGPGAGYMGSRYVANFSRWVDSTSIEVMTGCGLREIEARRIIEVYEVGDEMIGGYFSIYLDRDDMGRIIYTYRGTIESGAKFARRHGYSSSINGSVVYPWMTYRECQRDAKDMGAKAKFVRAT